MRSPQIYRRKYHPKVRAPKFTDINFIRTLGPQIFKKMIFKFLQWSKNNSLMRGPQIYGRKFYPEGEAFKFTDLNFNQTEGPPNQSSTSLIRHCIYTFIHFQHPSGINWEWISGLFWGLCGVYLVCQISFITYFKWYLSSMVYVVY
jgi:hypothetical protein